MARSIFRLAVTSCVAWISLNLAACSPSGLVLEGRVVDAQRQAVPAARIVVVNSAEGCINYENPKYIIYGKDHRRPYDDMSLVLAGPLGAESAVSERNGRCSARTQTGSDGRFRIVGLTADTYHLLVVHPERGMSAV